MNTRKSATPSRKSPWRRVLRYFWHGIIIIAPITLTALFLHWAFQKVDGLLRPHVQTPGLGFLLVILGVVLVGWVSSFFFMRMLFSFIDTWLERTPGVNFIYSSIRDFFDAFVGDKRRFTQAVLVNVLAEEVWMVGFLTDEDLTKLELGADYVAVYVPQAYNVAGQLYMVKRSRIRPLDDLASTDVMKYAVTGGAVEIAAIKKT